MDFKNLVYVNGVWIPQGYPGLSSLTTGQVLRATGAAAAAFGAVDLTNANAVTGALPNNRGGTGVTVIPKFKVHKNGVDQTGITTSTFITVTWSTEVYDTNNNFASNRFTPTVAGKYLLVCGLRLTGMSAASQCTVTLAKNGVEVCRGGTPIQANQDAQMTFATIEDANGSTDYFECSVFQNSGVSATIGGIAQHTYWAGTLLP